ncbi:MAG: TcpQ domain-containing protein, partial [Pseudomonadota bacterium]
MKIFKKFCTFALFSLLALVSFTSKSDAQNITPPPAPMSESTVMQPQAAMPLAPAMQPVVMPAPQPNIPTFNPTESWTITKTSLSQARGLQNMKLPCLMTTEFDNGFIMRLSGGGGSILAMAIDFRQNTFRQGKQYASAITTGGMTQTIKTRAFAPNVLLFGTREWPALYAALSQGTDMVVDVEGNIFRFMMSDVMGGLTRLEQCFDPSAASPMIAGLGTAPLPPTEPMSQQSAMAANPNWQAPNNAARTPLSNQPGLKNNALQTNTSSRSSLWQAGAGETLDVVLARWGAQAGVDVSWQAGPPIPVQTDFQYRGDFNGAVQALMAQNAAVSGLKANLVGDMAAATPAGPVPLMPVSTVSSRDQVRPVQKAPAGRFSAPSGSSLQGVLRLWAEQEGVEFVWQSSQNFVLKRGVNASGSFEQALQATLEQFVNDPVIYPTAR